VLATGSTSNGHGEMIASDNPRKLRWLELATRRALPPPDLEPLKLGEQTLDLVWRSHYVAAALDEVPPLVRTALEGSGFMMVSFGDDETSWETAFRTLESALGE